MKNLFFVFLQTILFLLVICLLSGKKIPNIVVIPVFPPLPDAPVMATEPGDSVNWLLYPKQKTKTNASWGKVLTDIEEHLPTSYGTQYNDARHITHGHETTHGINSELRNKYAKNGQNGFYCLDNRAAIIDNPKVTIRQIAVLVPASLKGSRYQLYLVQQAKDWNDIPTYIFDEWIAYINGTTVGIEEAGKSKESGSYDDGIAPMEFVYYSLAFCLAVKKYDVNFFNTNKQFREFVAFNIVRSVKCFRIAIKMKEFKWDTKIVDSFISGGDAANLRNLVLEMYGKDFCDKWLFTK